MGIAKVPAAIKPAQDYKPDIVSPNVRNEVVNTRYTPLKSLMTYVSGMIWEVQYFHQILGEHSEPMPLQFEESGVLQQYLKINRFTIKVQTGLSRNPNTSEGEMELTGAGALLPGITPNEGDMFIADIGDGRAGLFTITNIETMSPYKDTAYQIEYGFVDFLTPELDKNINGKTIEEAHYDIDYARTGKNPIIASADYFDREHLQACEAAMTRHYFTEIYDREFTTFLLPGQITTTYDPYLTRFVDKLIDGDKRPHTGYLVVYNETRGGDPKPTTLWDMLVAQDPNQFKYVCREMQVVDTVRFRSASALYGSLGNSGILQTIYPKLDMLNGTDIEHNYESIYNNYNYSNIDNININNTKNDSTLLPTSVEVYTSYVLTENFYKQDRPAMNVLELEVHNLITGKPINASHVKKMVDEYFLASKLVQFYTFPLLVSLCRTASYRL